MHQSSGHWTYYDTGSIQTCDSMWNVINAIVVSANPSLVMIYSCYLLYVLRSGAINHITHSRHAGTVSCCVLSLGSGGPSLSSVTTVRPFQRHVQLCVSDTGTGAICLGRIRGLVTVDASSLSKASLSESVSTEPELFLDAAEFEFLRPFCLHGAKPAQLNGPAESA